MKNKFFTRATFIWEYQGYYFANFHFIQYSINETINVLCQNCILTISTINLKLCQDVFLFLNKKPISWENKIVKNKVKKCKWFDNQ